MLRISVSDLKNLETRCSSYCLQHLFHYHSFHYFSFVNVKDINLSMSIQLRRLHHVM